MNFFFACLFSACQSLPSANDAPALQIPTVAPDDPRVLKTLQPQQALPLAATSPLPTQASEPPTAPQDIWDRLRAGFRLPTPKQAEISQELAWYRRHPSYLKRIQKRARPYLHFILEELQRRDMPTEIALLPAVESAFQPFAYSPGRAAGIWQFIPSTGRIYGLKQNWWYDGRRDLVASTRAALDYLKRLNRQFDGDWELALAAYNSGAGTVSKAIRYNRRHGRPTDFWSLKLPDETRDYVPRLLALSRVFAEPESYGIHLEPLPDTPYFASVDIGSQLDLALAAEMAGLTIQDIYRLNAGFNRWATDPDGPHRLNLPLERVERFTRRLEQLPREKRLHWKRYKIRPGDNLSTIAKRHGTTTRILEQVNKLSGHRIRAGRHLLIPVAAKRLDQYVYSAEQRKAHIQNRPRKGRRQEYVVKRGDSLWDIARAFKVGHRQLAKWNGMAPGDPIHPGQKLVIWVRKGDQRKPSRFDLQPSGIQSSVSYRVRQGDSLSRIAQRFRVSVSDLKKWNALPGKYLQPGQRLRLYVDVTEQTL